MIRREVRERSTEELIEEYPIADRLTNWFFRVVEVSNNAWRAEGSDRWGRKVSRNGGDPDTLLEACIADARSIAREEEHPPASSEQKAKCTICDQYVQNIEIHGPEQLRRIVATLQTAVGEGQLEAAVAESALIDLPAFSDLDLSDTLPDILAYRLECTACGRGFELSCECYHGAGGHWRPA